MNNQNGITLPSNWIPDRTLMRLAPSPYNYNAFSRLAECPDRYIVSIVGDGVYDLQDQRWLKPTVKNGRRSYRLNLGPHTRPIIRTYARLVCRAVYGDPPQPKGKTSAGRRRQSESHHIDGDVTNDHWNNLRWQSRQSNLAIEKDRMRHCGTKNGNSKLTDEQIALIRQSRTNAFLEQSIDELSIAYGVSKSYIHRIRSGKVRASAST